MMLETVKVGDIPARPVARARVAKVMRDIVKFGMEGSQLILNE
jgi:hypothetical protein